MRCALIYVADDTWASGPYEEDPPVPEGQRRINVPFNFPEKCYWSAEFDGFLDIKGAEPVTLLDWLKLFTQSERMAIRTKRRSTPTLDDQLALVEACAPSIRLDDPMVTAAVVSLVTAKLVTAARSTQILAGTSPA